MSERKPYLLRLPSDLMDELMRWAKDDLRSFNAQVEWILRDALRRKHRGAWTDPTALPDRPPPAGATPATVPQKRPDECADTDA